MKRIASILLLWLAMAATSCLWAGDLVIPAPTRVELGEGTLDEWSWRKVRFKRDKTIAPEGYRLRVTPRGVSVSASTEAGRFYARQTLEQLARHTGGSLPIVSIDDAPRFPYRGFMLDCSRHFFSVEEIERMLDLMATYKMNVFHWHLTDDQGWRAEIRRYPKLTSVGARRNDNWDTPLTLVQGQWWTGKGGFTGQSYGPFFYTQEEMRHVVAYARERHIEVLPEVDMPGHLVSAMAAYPEYSCTPEAPPAVWTQWGVSQHVLNVANPEAVRFAKDVLSELCSIFPYPYIHIGGDECPTTQWESNEACRRRQEELGLRSMRALQTLFIKEMADHVASHGKRLVCWNESVTAQGADLPLMQQTGATIMCWHPCQQGARRAAELGLDAIITEYHSATGGYYINRRQSNDYGEPEGAGAGDDTVEGCYRYVPVPSSVPDSLARHYRGVQATFWTEHVGSAVYLEYLALPRLICVAEAGWSPQGKKSWESFRQRLTAETPMLTERGYTYARHWMEGYQPRQAE